MIQLQAGYIFDSTKEMLTDNYPKEMIEGLLKQLSFFDIEVDSTENQYNNSHVEPTLFVAHNMILRGLPTRASLWAENAILQSNDQTDNDNKKYEAGENEIIQLFRALHIIEPALRGNAIHKKRIHSWEDSEVSFEEDFLYRQIPASLSEYWIQLLDVQQDLEKLLRFSMKAEEEIDKYTNGTFRIANEQKIDFTIEYPYLINDSGGIIFEIDGPQHEQPEQIYTDNNRDIATEKAKFGRAIRIKTDQWDRIHEAINKMEYIEKYTYFKTIKQNFEDPLYRNDDGLYASKIALMPYAIARIQMTILHLLLTGRLDINAEAWHIAVLERDVPCANIAFDDLTHLLKALSALQEEQIKFPVIHLSINSDPRFETSKRTSRSGIDKEKTYDLFIDISMLQRSGLTCINTEFNAKTNVLIRSSHAIRTHVSFKTSAPITYKALGYKNRRQGCFEEDNTQVGILRKFIQDIFRKTGFKAGQIEIINRMLQGENVIGLLPAGSGKSLTYQLATLLQPGMSMVAVPDQSRMKAVYEGLLKHGIDSAVYVHSFQRQKERKKAIAKIKNAQTLFALITPEKLQEDLFRKELYETNLLNQQCFSYCIIDEAHCVSEWGHDFKTSYIRLGDNMQEYCKTKHKKSIPIIAFTATASYDVLSDIQQAFQISEESAIVWPDNPDRPENRMKTTEVNAGPDINAGTNQDNIHDTITGNEEITKTNSIDKDVLLHFHFSEFNGFQKEQKQVTELLSEIEFPLRKMTDYIEERVLNEFSIDVKLTLDARSINREILYFSPLGGSIYLDRENLPLHIAQTPQAIKIADYIKQIIVSEKPDNITPFNWLNQPIHNNTSAPGIEVLLENDDTPDKFQVEIPFTNNKIKEITHYLNENNIACTEQMVCKAQNNCSEGTRFVENIERECNSDKKDRIYIPDHLKPSLQHLFAEIRNKQDTSQAIYRLYVIGVIDDYTVNDRSSTFSVTVTRKKQGYYTDRLRKYILQYDSPVNTDEKMKQLPLCKGNSEIQKCLNFLLQFIDEATVQQRKTAIDSIEEVHRMASQENGTLQSKEFVDLFMHAKYAYSAYLPADTDQGLKADFTIVEKYMDVVNARYGVINNLKHLRTAASRLSISFPDNFVFTLLKSFSLFLTGKDDFMIEEAQTDFITGFFKEWEATGRNSIHLKKKMDIFKQKVSQLDSGTIEKVEEAENTALLITHTNWLKNFNDNFIDL